VGCILAELVGRKPLFPGFFKEALSKSDPKIAKAIAQEVKVVEDIKGRRVDAAEPYVAPPVTARPTPIARPAPAPRVEAVAPPTLAAVVTPKPATIAPPPAAPRLPAFAAPLLIGISLLLGCGALVTRAIAAPCHLQSPILIALLLPGACSWLPARACLFLHPRPHCDANGPATAWRRPSHALPCSTLSAAQLQVLLASAGSLRSLRLDQPWHLLSSPQLAQRQHRRLL
jgi:hypothetical protein